MVNNPALEAVRHLFTQEQLDLPPLPPELAEHLIELDENIFGTRQSAPNIYFLRSYLDEWQESQPSDYLMLGYSGHGFLSYAMHYYLVKGNLAIFLQLEWGTPETDAAAMRQRINTYFSQVAQLLALPPQTERRIAVALSTQQIRAQWAWHGQAWNYERHNEVLEIVGQELINSDH